MRKIYISIFIVVISLTLLSGGFIISLQYLAKTPLAMVYSIDNSLYKVIFSLNPLTESDKQEKIITINKGESLINIAKKLESEKIIINRYIFIILAKYKGSNKKIKAGEYAFLNSYPPEKILDILVKGKVKQHRITIPEGLNIKETASIVETAGFGTKENFIKLTKDKDFISSLNSSLELKSYSTERVRSPSLEGYLFPDTYFFPAGTDQKKIIKSMVERFNNIFNLNWKEACKEIGLSVHQIVILASIIEKETGNASERTLISSVFHNRLKKGMRLESDPTVIYGIDDFNGNITKSDLLTVTPYNTYTIYGLPAGPISNPGKLSLEAAIFPERSGFLFFVSKNDTTHHFSETFEEHNLAVKKYQLKQ